MKQKKMTSSFWFEGLATDFINSSTIGRVRYDPSRYPNRAEMYDEREPTHTQHDHNHMLNMRRMVVPVSTLFAPCINTFRAIMLGTSSQRSSKGFDDDDPGANLFRTSSEGRKSNFGRLCVWGV